MQAISLVDHLRAVVLGVAHEKFNGAGSGRIAGDNFFIQSLFFYDVFSDLSARLQVVKSGVIIHRIRARRQTLVGDHRYLCLLGLLKRLGEVGGGDGGHDQAGSFLRDKFF